MSRRSRSPAATGQKKAAPLKFIIAKNGEEDSRYSITRQGSVKELPQTRSSSQTSLWYSLFVPDGYPHSVRDGYLRFQFFDSLQGLCSYLRGVLSTQAILEGLGVGTENASSLAATTQWVYRDGAGMVAGLVFAWFGANLFDSNVKRWRLFADISVDLALSLELASPLLCESARCFTVSVCTANVLKALCGVSAGATRAVITNHFAKDGNIADVQAKEGSQETAVNLIGMMLGLKLATLVDEHKQAGIAWGIFTVLTIVHLVANYYCVQALQLTTINERRLNVLVESSKKKGRDISAVNAQEAIIQSCRYHFVVGCRLPLSNESVVVTLVEKLRENPCVVLPTSRAHEVRLAVRDDAEGRDILQYLYCAVRGVSLKTGEKFVDDLEFNGWNVEQLALSDHKFRIDLVDDGE